MNDKFSVEEINLMSIFDISDKTALLDDLRESLPDIYDPEMREIYESTISKLENISDGEFNDIGFYIADDTYEDEEA